MLICDFFFIEVNNVPQALLDVQSRGPDSVEVPGERD